MYLLLDLNWYVAKKYTPERFDEEIRVIFNFFLFFFNFFIYNIQAIAEGSNFNYVTLRRLNMFPELTKASCTIIGAWGKSTENNKLL